jgi:hypothetical protein
MNDKTPVLIVTDKIVATTDAPASIVDPAQPFSYKKHEVPSSYKCGSCGAHGCKLWRDYQSFLNDQVLRCVTCAGTNQDKDVSDVDELGRLGCSTISPQSRTDQIGWLVPAVPTEENDTFWGYTSVPMWGVVWWRLLPTYPPKEE